MPCNATLIVTTPECFTSTFSAYNPGAWCFATRKRVLTCKLDRDTSVSTTGALFVGGAVAHDSPDSGNPIKIGARALAHGTNPGAVTAADVQDVGGG